MTLDEATKQIGPDKLKAMYQMAETIARRADRWADTVPDGVSAEEALRTFANSIRKTNQEMFPHLKN